VALLIGNERFKEQYLRFRFQIGILFVALFSFTIFSLPVLLKSIGPGIFLLSGVVSIGLIALFVYALSKSMPQKVRAAQRGIAVIVGSVYLAFNALYFAGAIPPLPLSLKEIGVYHSVNRLSGGSYVGVYEPAPRYAFYSDSSKTFHRTKGEAVTVFSAVFAPTDLAVAVLHEWQYFDDARQRWVTTDILSFPIVGGRDGGYRGYSTKAGVFEGRWRVEVITQHGQRIGQIRFSVQNTLKSPKIEERML